MAKPWIADVAKALGYAVIGGVAFYVFVNRQLPFANMGNAFFGFAAATTASPSEQENSDAREEEFRRALARGSICGGFMGELTPEILARIKEVEERKKNQSYNSSIHGPRDDSKRSI